MRTIVFCKRSLKRISKHKYTSEYGKIGRANTGKILITLFTELEETILRFIGSPKESKIA